MPLLLPIDPRPGSPADEQGNFLPLLEWKPDQPRPADWPPHIHPRREVDAQLRRADQQERDSRMTRARELLLASCDKSVHKVLRACPADRLPFGRFLLPGSEAGVVAELAWTEGNGSFVMSNLRESDKRIRERIERREAALGVDGLTKLEASRTRRVGSLEQRDDPISKRISAGQNRATLRASVSSV